MRLPHGHANIATLGARKTELATKFEVLTLPRLFG